MINKETYERLTDKDGATIYADVRKCVSRLAELEDKIMDGTLVEQNEWISVKEKLPNYDEKVLVYVPKRDGCSQNGIFTGGEMKANGIDIYKDKRFNPYIAQDDFDCGYHEYAKEQHKKRVAENPNRIAFAIKQFENNNIEYTLKNEATGHFHCRRKSDDKLFQFYAGTGKIVGVSNKRGIHEFIRILTD